MGSMRMGAVAEGVRHYLRLAPPLTKWIVHLIVAHKALAILGVIALEEMGVPLPLPGDLFIAYAGHLIARNLLDPVSAFLAVLVGAMAGSSVLYWLTRLYGQPFIKRYGRYMHIKPGRLARIETGFQRWGPLVIVVGRHVPGMRMVISVCSGLLGISYPVFLASVAVSSAVWAGLFLSLGYRFDRQIGPYLTLTPAHLIPSTAFIAGAIVYALVLRRRARQAGASSKTKVLSPSQARM